MRRFCKYLVFFIFLSSWLSIASAQVVNMPDANLRAVVRYTLGLAPNASMTRQALQKLTSLNARSSRIREITGREGKIRNISGLEHATQLTELWLFDNQIRDIDPLAGLTQLRILEIENNQIQNIRPLASLTKLKTLNIWNNPITDFRPLTRLKQLRALSANVRQISDLRTYIDLTRLTELQLNGDGQQIRDTHLLANLRQLTVLQVSFAQVRNLSFLRNLTRLRQLSLRGNGISTLQPLVGLKKLERLYIHNNQIRDLQPLAGLIQLTELDLAHNQIRDVSPLARLVNLEHLLLKDNPIQDAAPLSNLPKLNRVDINIPRSQTVSIPDANLAAAVRKVLGLGQNARITRQAMQRLTRLDARESQIKNLTGLEHATRLTGLYLYNNQIRNLTPLAGLTQLKYLGLGENQIRNIRPIIGLTQLELLHIGGNQIDNTGIRLLTGLERLKWLSLYHNKISNIEPLSHLTKLEGLWLSYNKIRDMSSLSGLVNLEALHLQGNSIRDISPLTGLTKLTDLRLSENPIEDMTPLRTLLKRNPDLELDIDTNQLAVVQVSASQRPPIYWVDTQKGTLHRLIGATVEHLMPYLKRVTSLAVDVTSGKIYWTDKTTHGKNDRRWRIRRANLNGTDKQTLKDLTQEPHGIALDVESGKIYLTNASGKIQELDFNGSNFQSNFITGLNSPKDIVVDRERDQLYWTESDSIWRADLNGSNREAFAPNLGELESITVTGGKIYSIERPGGEQHWQIRSSTLDGLTPPQTLVTLQSRPMGLAVDTAGSKLYWTTANGKIQRADLNGSNIQDVVTGLRAPGDIVLGVPTRTNPAAPWNTSLVTRTLPDETLLLTNYPNPFNPETWIPYQLATDTDAQLLIYDARGSIVRRLVLGHQRAGTYIDRSRAAYWDGRNSLGEQVASGVYFYQLQADEISFMRKMLIVK